MSKDLGYGKQGVGLGLSSPVTVLSPPPSRPVPEHVPAGVDPDGLERCWMKLQRRLGGSCVRSLCASVVPIIARVSCALPEGRQLPGFHPSSQRLPTSLRQRMKCRAGRRGSASSGPLWDGPDMGCLRLPFSLLPTIIQLPYSYTQSYSHTLTHTQTQWLSSRDTPSTTRRSGQSHPRIYSSRRSQGGSPSEGLALLILQPILSSFCSVHGAVPCHPGLTSEVSRVESSARHRRHRDQR